MIDSLTDFSRFFAIMSSPQISTSGTWLSLQDASKKVGVTPATLRQWANQGRVRTFRTPGGHRRFSALEIGALVGAAPVSHSNLRVETLVHSALGRARLDISDGRLETMSWYRGIDEIGRELHRKLGRQLMILLVRVLRGNENELLLVKKARKLGQEYGRASVREKINLSNSLRAFLFFRDYVFEDLIGFAQGGENLAEPESVERYRRANSFMNEILVAMVEIFSQEKAKK